MTDQVFLCFMSVCGTMLAMGLLVGSMFAELERKLKAFCDASVERAKVELEMDQELERRIDELEVKVFDE